MAHLARSKNLSIEMHIGPAITVLFFNDHKFGQESKCYLFEKGAERITPFLPILGKLFQEGPARLYCSTCSRLLHEPNNWRCLSRPEAHGLRPIPTSTNYG